MIAPLGAGVMSTVGFLTAPLAFDFVRSWRTPIEQWIGRAPTPAREMEAEGEASLETFGVRADHIIHKREAECATSARDTRFACRYRKARLARQSVSTDRGI